MNKKLLAVAVSAALAAPLAAQAESSFYARVNNAIDINDISGDGKTDVSGVSSRFGFKGSADIGNGLTAHGRYEFSTTTDKEGGNAYVKSVDFDKEETAKTTGGVDDIRIATVGLSGGFGRIDVGNQWSSYYNTFGTLVSPTYSLGYYLYSSVGGGPFRTSNTIKYSNTFGPLYAELDVRLNDSDEGSDVAEKIRGNGIGLGLSFAVTDNITIATSFDSEEGGDRAKSDAVSSIALRGTAAMSAMPAKDMVAQHNATASEVRDAVAAYTLLDPVDYNVVKKVASVTAIDLGDNIPTVPAVEAMPAKHASDDYAARVKGAAAQAADGAPDTDRVGVGIKFNFGPVAVTAGWQNMEVDEDGRTGVAEVDIDTMFINASGSLGEKTSWYLGYSEGNDGTNAIAAKANTVLDAAQATAINERLADGVPNVVVGDQLDDGTDAVASTDDSKQLTWGVYHNLGGGIKLYYEATSLDSENKEWDGDRHYLGMRVDF